MNRATLLKEVSARLGNRRLVWAGIRGDDAEPLADLPQFEAAHTIINAYSRRLSVDSTAYEDLTGVRVDLETWDIDAHLDAPETAHFRRIMLQALSMPSALLPYRPSSFLSAIWFARRDRCLNLGLFGGHQAAFEHKPCRSRSKCVRYNQNPASRVAVLIAGAHAKEPGECFFNF